MKRKLIYLSLGILIVIATMVSVVSFFSPLRRGWLLRHALISAAADASSIRVVEHSDRFDHPDEMKNYKEKIYGTVTLSADQVSGLLKAFPLSLDYSGMMAKKCIFSSHHRVEFLRRNGKATVLEICFLCREIDFDGGGQRIMPVGWPSSLQSFVVSLGMSPTPKDANNAGASGSP